MIGEIKFHSVAKGEMEVELPDTEKWVNDRVDLDDGTIDWVRWGPRLN